MVGTPHINEKMQKNKKARGAAMAPEALSPLDQERAASLADEGGCAGAVAERQDQRETPEQRSDTSRSNEPPQTGKSPAH